jgi:hypothetical protein
MIELSEHTQQIVERLFQAKDWKRASGVLESGCGDNLPMLGKPNPDPHSMERLRFAALKLSDGEIEKLRQAIILAQQDWRDLLMAAGFGHSLDEHKKWAEEILRQRLLPE